MLAVKIIFRFERGTACLGVPILHFCESRIGPSPCRPTSTALHRATWGRPTTRHARLAPGPERTRWEGALAPSHLVVGPNPQVSPALFRRLPHGQVLFRGGGICWLPRVRAPPPSMSGGRTLPPVALRSPAVRSA